MAPPCVCVIGAGPSGLTCAKSMLDRDYKVTVFDTATDVGGLWRSSLAYDCLTTNTSFAMMQFSDFSSSSSSSASPDAGPSHFKSASQVAEYYKQYAIRFNLLPVIRLGWTVRNVKLLSPSSCGKRWQVVATCNSTSQSTTMSFDFVCVCVGRFCIPKLPRNLIPLSSSASSSFSSSNNSKQLGALRACRFLHSSAYRNARGLQGKRAVVVGIGNSAIDIALDMADAGVEHVTMVIRSAVTLWPAHTPSGHAMDQLFLTRAYHTLPGKWKMNLFNAVGRQVQQESQRYGFPAVPPDILKNPAKVTPSIIKRPQAWLQYLRTGVIRFCSIGTTENDNNNSENHRTLLLETECGLCVKRGESVSIMLSASCVVYCTGYSNDMKFLEQSGVAMPWDFQNIAAGLATPSPSAPTASNTENDGAQLDNGDPQLWLYKSMLHPVEHSLAFIGQIHTVGNYAVVAEMQARWCAWAWAVHATTTTTTPSLSILPPPSKLLAHLTQQHARFHKLKPKMRNFVNYVMYMDDLASDMGVLPKNVSVVGNGMLQVALFREPVVAAQYQLMRSSSSSSSSCGCSKEHITKVVMRRTPHRHQHKNDNGNSIHSKL